MAEASVKPKRVRKRAPGTTLPVVHNGSKRPPLSDSVVKKIMQGLRGGMTRRAASGFGGIHHDTLYDWMANKPGFREQVEQAENVAEARYTATVMHHGITAQDAPSAFRWLERRRPNEWREQMKVIEQPLAVALDERLTDDDVSDELQEIGQELRRRRAVGAGGSTEAGSEDPVRPDGAS